MNIFLLETQGVGLEGLWSSVCCLSLAGGAEPGALGSGLKVVCPQWGSQHWGMQVRLGETEEGAQDQTSLPQAGIEAPKA